MQSWEAACDADVRVQTTQIPSTHSDADLCGRSGPRSARDGARMVLWWGNKDEALDHQRDRCTCPLFGHEQDRRATRTCQYTNVYRSVIPWTTTLPKTRLAANTREEARRGAACRFTRPPCLLKNTSKPPLPPHTLFRRAAHLAVSPWPRLRFSIAESSAVAERQCMRACDTVTTRAVLCLVRTVLYIQCSTTSHRNVLREKWLWRSRSLPLGMYMATG